MFYSHVIYLGTKIKQYKNEAGTAFYSHVIYLGTKIKQEILRLASGFTVT